MRKKGENGKYYNKKQREYVKKYRLKLGRIEISIPKGDKEMYRKQMEKMGYNNWTQFITDAINYFITNTSPNDKT